MVDYLKSEKVKKKITEIIKKFKVEREKTRIENLIKEVVSGNVYIEAVIYLLEQDIGLDFDQAVDVGHELIRDIFEPIQKKIKERRKKYEEEIIETKEEAPESEPESEAEKEKLEEEAEIAKIKKEGPKIEVEAISIDELVKGVVEGTDLDLKDEILKRRFANIVSAYVRDVRDDEETKETLVRSEKIGGMALAEGVADGIINILKTQKPQVKIVAKPVSPPKETDWIPEPPKPPTPPPPPESPKPKSKEKPKTPPPPEFIPKEPEGPPVEEPGPKEEEKVVEVEPRPEEGKRVEDVKAPPKVTGPVEELRDLKLADFRRWSDSPKDSTIRIQQKIDLLEQENLTKKVAGIHAWQESEIYKLYIDIGQVALKEGKPLEQVIQERTSKGQPTLTLDEFKAIVGLNQKLRF